MNKLNLNLDDLQVTSFATQDESADADGTVHGQVDTGANICLRPIESYFGSCFNCSLLQTECGGCGTDFGCGTLDIGCGQETLLCPQTLDCPTFQLCPPDDTLYCPY
jgi:hypothetical protein